MFDGVPTDQFHQFITPRTSLPLHLSIPLHASATPNSTLPPFDPYNVNTASHHHQLPLQQPNFLHPLHHHASSAHKHEQEKEETNTRLSPMNFDNIAAARQDHTQLPDDELINSSTWTNDEVLALLRIRSNIESWFPELTWEHVSRKLAEVGYKKSAEKCKEKFEEESRYFNNMNKNNYRFLSELEQLYHHQNPDEDDDQVVGAEKPSTDQEEGHQDKNNMKDKDLTMTKQCCEERSNTDGHDEEEPVVEKSKELRKRKRPNDDVRFEMFKGFCESIVHKMMAQQEEMHNKLLQDLLKRDEEKFAKEEAWKKQEMDRMNKELQVMAFEQTIAGNRHATIVEFLNKFTPNNHNGASSQNPSDPPSTGENNNALYPTPSTFIILNHQNIDGKYSSPLQNPIPQDTILQVASSSTSAPPASNKSSFSSKHDVGRRWPRDEVLALINLRCSISCTVNNNNSYEEIKEGNNKTPLWERISQGMLELGYSRSAKRCKEKWENINKYFRKTKDANKKRSLDSRTCPYFHQLSNLYNQGNLNLVPENHLNHPPSPPGNPEGQVQLDHDDQTIKNIDKSSEVVGPGGKLSMDDVDHGGEKTVMQVPASSDFNDDQF